MRSRTSCIMKCLDSHQQRGVVMPVSDEVEYAQISEDWRHRDNLTWQIPSVIVVVGGGLVAAAFAVDIDPQYSCIIRPILLGSGTFLSLCLTFALAQNLWYQMGSAEALKRIVNGRGSTIPNKKERRTLRPEDFDISKRDSIGRLLGTLTGSASLLILCGAVTFVLFTLFFWLICG